MELCVTGPSCLLEPLEPLAQGLQKMGASKYPSIAQFCNILFIFCKHIHISSSFSWTLLFSFGTSWPFFFTSYVIYARCWPKLSFIILASGRQHLDMVWGPPWFLWPRASVKLEKALIRTLEHITDLMKNKKDSPLVKHKNLQHKGENDVKFTFKIENVFQDPLTRQCNEGVRIKNAGKSF